MPHNLLNKKQWLAELDSLTNTYIDFINKLSSSKNEAELDIILSKKYKSNDLIFLGQEIIDNIQKKLADDVNYVYEFRVVDNKPVIKRMYRVLFDDQEISRIKELGAKGNFKADSIVLTNKDGEVLTIKNDNIIVTIEDLKSKHVEALMEIAKLKAEVNKKDEENRVVFMELVEAVGGLYTYASKNKLILMLSKILKELELYDNELGTQYSYERLNAGNKDKVINILYTKSHSK